MAGPSAVSTYTDFLVLGKTGMGKSTTADRLLVADSVPGAGNVTPVEKEGGNTQLDDILIWKLSKRSIKDVKNRVMCFLKNRDGKITGTKAINPETETPDSSTNDCVLLSNEKTGIRVLDVPGFHSSLSSQQLAAKKVAIQDNLGIMRQIVRIQAVNQLRFHRILYFLPCRGVCEKADSNYQEELKVMYHYFGRVIFDSMIIVATERRSRSTLDALSEDDFADNLKVFKRAFQLVIAEPDQDPDEIEVQDIPQPPIIYLSLEESGSDLRRRVEQERVTKLDGLQLQLRENTCARCSLKFGMHKMATGFLPVVSLPENDGVRSAYDQSRCHPLIIPKYTFYERFVGGIYYLRERLGIPLPVTEGTLPGFFNHEEKCANCKNPPGSPGCTQIGTKWEKIVVKHKSELDHVYIQVQE